MGLKFYLLLFFVSLSSAQSIEEFLTKIQAGRDFAENPCAGRPGAHFARNSRGCAWYFACNANNEITREDRCDRGLRFNYQQQTCDFEENVSCDFDDRWINVVCTPDRGIQIVPHPYSCSKYTICFDGIQNDRSCPDGKHFSYYDNACVDPFLADCNLDKILCRESIETGNAVILPNTRDCQSYFVCVGETAVPLRCSPQTQYSIEHQWCDDPDVANCEPLIPDDVPRIPDKVFLDCQGQSGIAVPHPESCEFFFFCAGDRSYLQACGEGLIFDIRTERCQLAEEAQCILDIDQTIAPPETDAPETEAPPIPVKKVLFK